MNKLEKLVASEIVKQLSDYKGIMINEIMNEMYNLDFYIIGTYKAREFFKEHLHEISDIIEFVKEEYYINVDLSNIERFVSIAVLEQANQVFYCLETVSDNYDKELTDGLIEEIIAELKYKYNLE